MSSGPFALTVPDVLGLTEAAARAELEAAGFQVVVEEEFSTDVVEGFVIRTEPGPQQLVGRDNPSVTVFVSMGPEPFQLPDFVGRTVAEAQELATGLGLELIIDSVPVEVPLASGLVDLIAAQEPAAGSDVTVNDPVRVQLGVARQIDVPNLIGLTEEEAVELLANRGLLLEVVGTVQVDPESGLDQNIAGQEPAGGETLPEGSTVSVQIGVAPPEQPTTTTTQAP